MLDLVSFVLDQVLSLNLPHGDKWLLDTCGIGTDEDGQHKVVFPVSPSL